MDNPANYVECPNLRRLVDLVGSQKKVADMLGCSPSNVSRGRHTGVSAKHYELAATQILSTVQHELTGSPPEAILEHIRLDIEFAKQEGLTGFRFDEDGVLRSGRAVIMGNHSPSQWVSVYPNGAGFPRMVLSPEMVLERFKLCRLRDDNEPFLYGMAVVQADPLEMVLSSRLEGVKPGVKNQSQPVTVITEEGEKFAGFTVYWPHGKWSGLRLEREGSRAGIPTLDDSGASLSDKGHPLFFVNERSRAWGHRDGHHGAILCFDVSATYERAPVQTGFI